MNFPNTQFITSAPALEECPDPNYPEFCFAGRSNVGKSSLINSIVNQNNLARTSNVPGKTQQMNYYQVDDRAFFVDLPGFGYAKVPMKERERWGRDIRSYLLNRETLRLVIHLVDIRHEPTPLDEDFFYWLGTHAIPFCVVLSKADKLSGNKRVQSKVRLEKILEEMNIEVPILLVSSDTGRGTDELKALISEFAEG